MQYTIVKKEKLPKSEFLVELSIPPEEIRLHEDHVLSDMALHAELPGFRKGRVPKEMLRSRMGETALFADAAMDALKHALGEIIETEKLEVIGTPKVDALKLAAGNEAVFRITLTLLPKLTLPDYKDLAKKENGVPEEVPEVTEKEVEEVIAEIDKQQQAETGNKEFRLTDENIGKFGLPAGADSTQAGPFATLAEVRTKIKGDLEIQKKQRTTEKRRIKLLERLRNESSGDIPELLIETELQKMEAEFKGELERMGISWENYLREIKKDTDTLRKEWRKNAKERALLDAVLFTIAKQEHLTATEPEIEREAGHIKEHYPEADMESARRFVEVMLVKGKVMAFLEGIH
ncbi:MAG: trigger factor [bacterium]|nr:trigger factor [bacterium]